MDSLSTEQARNIASGSALRIADVLDVVSHFSRFYATGMDEELSTADILHHLTHVLSKLMPVNGIGYYMTTPETVEFTPRMFSGAWSEEQLCSLVDHHIEEGTFSWALYQNRLVSVAAPERTACKLLLHVLATRQQIVGMMVCVVDEDLTVETTVEQLVTTVLSQAAGLIENHRLTQHLSKVNQELESKVEERTGDYLAAQQAASEASRAQGEFLTRMNYELRTPLNVVVGTVDMLNQSSMDPIQRRYFQTIRQSCDSMLGLIEHHLDVANIMNGVMAVQSEAFAMEEVVENSLDMMSAPAFQKGLNFWGHLDRAVPAMVFGDKRRIEQLMINLLFYGLQVTESGYVELAVRLREQAGEDETAGLRIVVTTTESCWDEEYRRKMEWMESLDPSALEGLRLEDSRSELTYIRTLTQLLDSRFHVVQPAPGGDEKRLLTEYRIDLDLKVLPKPMAPPSSRSSACSGKRVILISDDDESVETLCQQLSRLGITADLIHQVNQVERLLERGKSLEKPYHGVLYYSRYWESDFQNLNQILTRIQRENSALASVLVMPKSVSIEQTSQALDGFRHVLYRPLHFKELKWALESMWQPAKAHLASPPAPTRSPQVAETLDNGPASAFQSSAPQPKASPPQVIDAPKESPAGGDGQYRVMLVEDNVINAKVIVAILSRLNCQVVHWEEGQLAVDDFEPGKYDLIFMDYMMPGLDGIQTTERIRAKEGAAKGIPTETPIVAVTACADVNIREACLQGGMNDFLTKPVTMAQLNQALKKWLPQRADS